MDIASGSFNTVAEGNEIHDANWLGDGSNAILFLKDGEKGATLIMVANANKPENPPYVAGEINGRVQAVRLKPLEDGNIAIAVVGLATPESGNLYNEVTAPQKASTGKIYTNFRVRLWTQYKKEQTYSIFYSLLVQSPDGWKLSAPLRNVNYSLSLDDVPDGTYESNGRDRYDISHNGVVFAANDPDVRHQPTYARVSDVYHVPVSFFSEQTKNKPRKVDRNGIAPFGWVNNPRFSPDGSNIAFIKGPYEYYIDMRIYLTDVRSGLTVEVISHISGTPWHLPAGDFEFSQSGESLYISAEDRARKGLYKLNLKSKAKPRELIRDGHVTGFHPIGKSKSEAMLVTSTSLVDNALYRIIDTTSQNDPKVVYSATRHGALWGISSSQATEVSYRGAGDYDVHTWIVKPSDFDQKKKYPVAILLHGGPDDAWRLQYHERWNRMAWTEQGFIVVSPNITGSTGFGLKYTADLWGQYGGRPYDDVEKCMEFLKKHSYIDLDRAVLAGASYGGYLVNWIQGRPLGRKFKAIVSVESVFDTVKTPLESDYTTGGPEFQGPNYPWENIENMEKWNPAKPQMLKDWTTPMLVIQNELDYRLPVTQGIAAFRVLQSLGTPSMFLTFPDEGHFIEGPENLLLWYQTIFAWVKKYAQ